MSEMAAKDRCFTICLLFAFFVLLTVWRTLSNSACNHGLDCSASIGAFFGALIGGCGLCTFAIYVNWPEHRYYVPKSETYPDGKGVVYDTITGHPKVHSRGIDLPWNPHQQIALMCIGTVIWLFAAVLWPALDMQSDGSLAVVTVWSVLLAAGVVLVTWLSMYDPSDGIELEQLRKLAHAPSFEKYCFICNKVYMGNYRYHCRRCNKCTTHFDHHCTFLNQCICGANYTAFFATLVILMCWLYYTSVLGVYYSVLAGVDDSSSVALHARSTWGRGWFITMTSALAGLSLLGAIALTALFHKHSRLILANRKAGPDKWIATFGGFQSIYEFDDQEMRRITTRAADILYSWRTDQRAIVNWKMNTPWKDGRSHVRLFEEDVAADGQKDEQTRERRGTIEGLMGNNADGQSTIKSLRNPMSDTRRKSRASRFFAAVAGFFGGGVEELEIENDRSTQSIALPTMQQKAAAAEDEVYLSSIVV